MTERKRSTLLKEEWPVVISVATMILFFLFGKVWLTDLSAVPRLIGLFIWLVGATSASIFAVARHADILAAKLGEPTGTLILTLVVTGIEAVVVASTMFANVGDGGVDVARDTMFAVVMIVLNGMIGLSLLLGGLRHHEQSYNLQGASSFLAVIVPVSVLAMVLPSFTSSSPGQTLSRLHAVFLIGMSVGLYAVFLTIQNLRHRHYFLAPDAQNVDVTDQFAGEGDTHSGHSLGWHATLLVTYAIPVVVLSEQIGVAIEATVHALDAPAALGGVIVAALVLAPESVSAVRAAVSNQLQRAVNVLLGSALATISLTIPVVLCVALITGKSLALGLDGKDMTMLLLTLFVSVMTFTTSRTNVLLGAVHMLLFLAYTMLIFDR